MSLADFSRKPIRKFLRNPPDEATELEFWKAVYRGVTRVLDHREAVDVVAELDSSDRPVQDVIDGWKPAAIGGAK